MRRSHWLLILSLVLSLPAAGLPPLTDAQREQLATADESQKPDQPALYALLPNVLEWDRSEAARGYVPGAAVPDFEALWTDPQTERGELFVIEGTYAGRQRSMQLLRPGPWGEALTEWGVVVGGRHGGGGVASGAEQVVIVYLVDPSGQIEPPPAGAKVRLAARFYSLWSDQDAQGHAQVYPVFVGRSAEVIRAEGAAARGCRRCWWA